MFPLYVCTCKGPPVHLLFINNCVDDGHDLVIIAISFNFKFKTIIHISNYVGQTKNDNEKVRYTTSYNFVILKTLGTI